MARIAILDAGFMGSALIVPAADNGHAVALWGTHLDDHLIAAVRRGEPHSKPGGSPATAGAWCCSRWGRSRSTARTCRSWWALLGAEEELARRIAPHLRRAGWRPVLAPAIPYGVSTLAADWSGTVSLSVALVTRLNRGGDPRARAPRLEEAAERIMALRRRLIAAQVIRALGGRRPRRRARRRSRTRRTAQRSRAAGIPASEVAVLTARTIAAATVSTAAAPTASTGARSSPTDRQKRVSPSVAR